MSGDLKAKLAQLKELHELGLLTDDAYQDQQKAITAAAMGSTPASPTRPSPLPPATVSQAGTNVAALELGRRRRGVALAVTAAVLVFAGASWWWQVEEARLAADEVRLAAEREAEEARLAAEEARLAAEREAEEARLAALGDLASAEGWSSARFVVVPAGTSPVGSREGEGEDYERPRHDVTLSRSFWMGTTEVTQGQWVSLMGNNPSEFSSCGLECPVERVSWLDAARFANAASTAAGLSPCYVIDGTQVEWPDGLACEGFRLPTEHEWEVAARAGTDFKYAGSDDLGSVGWFVDNSGGETHPVGQKTANGWGLHDMSGNVWEWCWDWKDSSAYQSGTMADPVGPQSGASRVLRGGCWSGVASDARVADRDGGDPSNRGGGLGFRLTRTRP